MSDTATPVTRIGLLVRLAVFTAAMLLVVPYLIVFVTSFDPSPAGVFPPQGFSLRWYANVFERHAFIDGFWLSTGLAVCSATLAVTIGTAASFVLVRHEFPGREVVNTLILAPLMVPQVVAGLGFLIFFTKTGVTNSFLGIMLSHVVLAVPFVVRVVAARLYGFPISVEEAAMTLGASRLLTMWRITLPMIKDALFAASIFAFVISFDNFNLSVFLVRGRGTLPVEIYSYARTEGDPTVAAISTLLMLLGAVALIGALRLLGLETLARTKR
jgi:putative spermidine/putrescine transport system permease protein